MADKENLPYIIVEEVIDANGCSGWSSGISTAFSKKVSKYCIIGYVPVGGVNVNRYNDSGGNLRYRYSQAMIIPK